MINKVIIVGYLGADPELRYTSGGTAVSNFSVATSRKWKDKSGQTKEETEWVKVVAWGKTAEVCKEYLAKGKLVYVEGRLQTSSWEDRDGNKRYKTEVVTEQVKFLGGGGKSGGGGRAGGRDETPPMDDAPHNLGDDDIPF